VTVSASVGTISQAAGNNGSWWWWFDASDGPDDSQAVVITATDSDGASSTATFDLTVNNVVPSVTADGDEIDEGGTASVSGEIVDPGADSVTTVMVDWGDGTDATPARLRRVRYRVHLADVSRYVWRYAYRFVASHQYPDDDPAGSPSDDYTVTVTVTDDDDCVVTAFTTVTVNNVAPTADAGPDQIGVFRYQTVEVDGTWTDPAGTSDEPYAWSWDLDGDGAPDVNGLAAFGDTVTQTTSFALPGTYTLTFEVADDDDGTDDDTVDIEVINRSPDCTTATPSVGTIWPPNHKMVSVDILGCTDPDGDDLTITITGISQDEPVNTIGDGNSEPDGDGVGTSTAQVRAERSGTKKVPGDGRIYEISFSADDGFGGVCDGSVTVTVPHDKGKKGAAVDSGVRYDSTVL